MVRMHVVLPEHLVKAVDGLAGKGKRSRFIEDAIREKLRRETLVNALEGTAGVLSAKAHPEWATGEQVASWVKSVRQQDDRGPQDRSSG